MKKTFLPIVLTAGIFTTACTPDNIQSTVKDPETKKSQDIKIESPKPIKLCDEFASEVVAFRSDIQKVNAKVNFETDKSVRKSFADSGIEGKIDFTSSPASFNRNDRGFVVKNSLASFKLKTGTNIHSGFFDQPYGRVVQSRAEQNKMENPDKNKPSLLFDNIDSGLEKLTDQNKIRIRFGEDEDECPGITPTKK